MTAQTVEVDASIAPMALNSLIGDPRRPRLQIATLVSRTTASFHPSSLESTAANIIGGPTKKIEISPRKIRWCTARRYMISLGWLRLFQSDRTAALREGLHA